MGQNRRRTTKATMLVAAIVLASLFSLMATPITRAASTTSHQDLIGCSAQRTDLASSAAGLLTDTPEHSDPAGDGVTLDEIKEALNLTDLDIDDRTLEKLLSHPIYNGKTLWDLAEAVTVEKGYAESLQEGELKRALALIEATGVITGFVDTSCEITWEKIEGPWAQKYDTSFGSVAIDPSDPKIVYIGSMGTQKKYDEGGCGIYKSADAGQTWKPLNNGLPKLRFTSRYYPVSALAIAPADPRIVYAGTEDPFPPSYLPSSGFGKGVYKLTDGGEKWSEANGVGDNPRLPQLSVRTLNVDPHDPNVLYTGLYIGGLYKSVYGGDSWLESNHGLPILLPAEEFSVDALAIDPQDARIIYVSGYRVVHFPHPQGISPTPAEPMGIYKSSSAGAIWDKLSEVDEPTPHIYDLAVDPHDRNIIYAATGPWLNYPWTGVYKSSDAGETWRQANGSGDNKLPEGVVDLVRICPSPGNIYAAVGFKGIFRSTDGGGHWIACNEGLPDGISVRDLAVGTDSTSHYLYVVSNKGVYRAVYQRAAPIPPTRHLDVVLATDRSGSMSGQKISDAKDTAKTFVRLVKQLGDQDRVGLVSFSTSATLDCPLTSDFEAARNVIETYEAGGQTNMGDALSKSISELRTSGREDVIWSIIYFTDGKTNEGPSKDAILKDLVQQAVDADIIIYTLGYGSDVDSSFLSQVASAANGKYYFAPDSAKLMEIYTELSQQAKAMKKGDEFRNSVSSGETRWERFWVELETIFMRIFLIWPGSDLDLLLIDPSGTTIEPGMPGVVYSGNTLPEYYEIYDPEPGEWSIGIYGKDVTGTTEDYTVMVFQPCALMQVKPTRCEIDYPTETMATFTVSEIGGMVDLENVVFTASDLTEIGGAATISRNSLTFSRNNLTVSAGSSQEVQASLTIGPDTALGDYSGSITVTCKENTTTITVVAKITNRPPVADAGSRISYVAPLPATTGKVILDGSGSYDPDADPLSYTWSYEGNTATGANPVVELPWGTTTITLVVSDGRLDSASDTIEIAVEPAAPARGLNNVYQWCAMAILILFAGASLWVLLRSIRFRT